MAAVTLVASKAPPIAKSLQSGIHHLASLVSTAAVKEICHVVSMGEVSIRDILTKELVEQSLTILNLVLKQSL